MKRFRILGFDVRFFFSLRRIKRLTFDLPDWADDTCITTLDTYYNPISHKIKYYKGGTPYYIDLPKCNDAEVVSLVPMVKKVSGERVAMTNRKIVVDVFF